MRMPGMSRGSLLRLLGELGHDFTTKFVDVKHFVSWVNLVPNNKISSGALLSSKIPKKKNPAGIIFRQAANTLKAAKCPLGDYSDTCELKEGIVRLWLQQAKSSLLSFTSWYTNHRKEELQNKVIYLQKQLQRMELELANCR